MIKIITHARRQMSMNNQELEKRVQGILENKRVALSRTITMIESTRPDVKNDADKILNLLLASTPERRNKAIRIGICGAPGAGKSSLIEKLGMHVVKKNKLAVLAIDPSSERSGGSILGDKTRMDLLSLHENAFIRPSPTRGILGGITLNTGEVQLLCEHAGYDAIVTETVGVGQSEIEINHVSDFVVFVVPPGSGDGLQGAKKGVMEIADMICINKYDGEYKPVCQQLQRKLQSALTLTRSKHDGVDWHCPVELVSAQDDYNIERIWETALYFKNTVGQDYLMDRRVKQQRRAMWKYLGEATMQRLKDPQNSYLVQESESKLTAGEISGHQAAQAILNKLFLR